MVIFFKGSNSTLSGWFSYSGGLFMCDTFSKRKAIEAYRRHYGLKGKHISFYFNDENGLKLYR